MGSQNTHRETSSTVPISGSLPVFLQRPPTNAKVPQDGSHCSKVMHGHRCWTIVLPWCLAPGSVDPVLRQEVMISKLWLWLLSPHSWEVDVWGAGRISPAVAAGEFASRTHRDSFPAPSCQEADLWALTLGTMMWENPAGLGGPDIWIP